MGWDGVQHPSGTTPRRRFPRWLLLSAIGMVAALTAVSCRDDDTPGSRATPAVATSVTGPGTGPVARAGLLDQPTRGSLATDRPFLDALRALPWSDGPPRLLPDGSVPQTPPDPPPDLRRVVFAGDVPGGRWAVVVGPIDSGSGPGVLPGITGDLNLAAVAFTGPRGAAPQQLTRLGGVNSVPANWTPALLDATTSTLLVVAPPGDQVEVSARPEIAADGSATRTYRGVQTTDGVAIVQLAAPGHDNRAPAFRLVRNGRPENLQLPWSVNPAEGIASDIPIHYPRGAPSDTGRTAAARTAAQILAEIGLRAGDVDVTAQWVGAVPGSGPDEIAVVTVTLPSGAVVVEAQLMGPEQTGGSSMGGVCGRAVLPAGPPAARRLYALTCGMIDVTSGAPRGTDLVVVGPPGVTLVRTYGADWALLTEYPAADGVVVVPLPQGTDTVEALLPGGVTLGRVGLLGYAESFSD